MRFDRFTSLPETARGASLALGNFDGLHIGHAAVIEAARAHRADTNVPWGVASFEPPPRQFFQPAAAPFRIMTAETRAETLTEMGADLVFELPFDAAMAAMTDRDFAEQVLRDGLGVSHVAIGFDFCFGRGRMGNPDTLRRFGHEMGFAVSVVEKVETGAVRVSSTAIRQALEVGDVARAVELMGRAWTVTGTVEAGAQRGRTIGFPTANLRLGPLIQPLHGVYAVKVRVGTETGWHDGVANFGRTPTVGERDPLLEVNLFDFKGDLYGQTLTVAFFHFLRPERKFEGIEALKDQIARDAEAARKVLRV